MKTIAVYNLKGGVGKTSIAVNLAACAAKNSQRRTLLWDLDPQGSASWLISDRSQDGAEALAIFDRTQKLAKVARPSRVEGVDIIAADKSLRELDRYLVGNVGRGRLAKLATSLAKRYDRLIFDCAPGLDEATEQVLRAADIVIVPIVPSALSERALGEVVGHIRGTFKKKENVSLLPVFSMVDRRRARHKAALEANPSWPVIPMASVVERMAESRESILTLAPSSPAGKAFAALWRAIEDRLSEQEAT